MTKQNEVAQELFDMCKRAYLTIGDVQAYTGFYYRKAARLVAELPAYGENTGKRWFYKDVAAAICANGNTLAQAPVRKVKRA